MRKGKAAAKPRTRPRGYAPWNPKATSLVLLEQVRAVLAEYAAHLPLTGRQIFYRLVGVHGYPKTNAAAKRLGEMMVRARRSERLPWTAIRDDDFTLSKPHSWESPTALLRTVAAEVDRFRLDRQAGQPVRLLIACEARGMMPQVERIAHGYGIPVMSSGGFDSVTAKYALAGIAKAWPAAEILHIGDHDPSGEALFTALAEDVQAFAPGSSIRFTRLAVTSQQIAELGLPTALPKPTDRRKFQGMTAQAEAIAPDTLAEIIRDAIDDRIDRLALDGVLGREVAAKRALLPVLGSLRLEGGDDAQG